MSAGREEASRFRRQETIPVSDHGRPGDAGPSFRDDALKKIHAQSSAETSGLGDSLQRIHTLSSTETSGYGDTVPSPTAPSPSPERTRAYQPEDSYINNPGRPVKRRPSFEMAVYADNRGRPAAGRSQDAETDFTDLKYAFPSGRAIAAESPAYSTAAHRSRQHHGSSATVRAMDPKQLGLDPDIYRAEMGTYSPMDSPSLSRHGSMLGVSNQILLGRTVKSAWLKWSQDRRASFKKKLDHLEQRQREAELNRVSTPVRKARKESVMFVSPEMEEQHLPTDDPFDTNLYLTEHAIPLSKKVRKEEDERDVKLTIAQWNRLLAFWEHDIFVRCRIVAIVLSLLALILGLISITSADWSRFTAHYIYGASHSGLWQICSSIQGNGSTTSQPRVLLGENCTSILSDRIRDDRGYHLGIWDACHYSISHSHGNAVAENCTEKRHHWQNAVIGLMIFSVAFGFLATILSICGVCTTTLAKKIYYYHSAGEIYLICALSVMAALIVYPVSIEVEKKMTSHTYGSGYGLGWGTSFLYAAAAMCMCLDDLVRTLSRGMCVCCSNKLPGNARV